MACKKKKRKKKKKGNYLRTAGGLAGAAVGISVATKMLKTI